MARGTVVPLRRPPPPRRPGRLRGGWRRLADPLFYLRAVILVAGVGLLVVPLAVDGVSAALHPVVSGNDTCRILTVIDGDTVTLTCAGSGVATARLMGFDAPELFSPECAGELIAAQKAQWALRAAIFTAEKIKLQREGRDRYDRTLVWIWLDGKPIHRTMISQGYGRAYDGGQRGVWCD